MQAVFLLPPRVHLLDITGPAHVFYEASCYGAPARLLFSSIFSGQTESISSCTLSFARLTPFDHLQLQSGDLIFIPGLDGTLLLDDQFLENSRPFQSWLKEQLLKGVIICSVCTGAFLLAEAGLLNGLSCTTHWKYADRFRLRYPETKFLANRLFVQENQIYTSAGVSSGIDLALHVIQQLWGPYMATQVAREVVLYFRRGPEDYQLNVFTQYRNHLDHRIHVVQDQLIHSLHQKLTIDYLADLVAMSPRNLTRLFRNTTHITIGTYLERLRAGRAHQLLSEGQTLQATALSCGLKSTNQLRTLLKRHPAH